MAEAGPSPALCTGVGAQGECEGRVEGARPSKQAALPDVGTAAARQSLGTAGSCVGTTVTSEGTW